MKKLSSPFDLIKKAVNVFAKKENFVYLVKIYLPILPFSIIAIVQNYLLASIKDSRPELFVLVITAVQILSSLVGIFVLASAIEAVRRVIMGESLSVKNAFKIGWKKYWMFLLLGIILSLVYGLGFLLLIVPGLLFIVWFAFARFIAIDSDLSIKEILLKSKEMSKGIYWKVIGRLVVFGIFAWSVRLILDFVPYGIGYVFSIAISALFILPSYLLYREIKD